MKDANVKTMEFSSYPYLFLRQRRPGVIKQSADSIAAIITVLVLYLVATKMDGKTLRYKKDLRLC